MRARLCFALNKRFAGSGIPMRRIIKVIDKVNSIVGHIAGALMVPLVFITAFEVVMRYIIQRPTIWAWDLNIQVFAAVNLLGGGYTLLVKGHVTVDVFVLNLSEKKRAVLDLITALFFFLGVLVLLVGGWEIAWMSVKSRETMPTVWAPPYYTMRLLIPVGAFFVLIQGISEFLKNLLIVFRNEQGD
jgi:TRAP-type mannitol/chloroaromatic compound transport system permease small subunit